MIPKTCPNCGSPTALYVRTEYDGSLVCQKCGYVLVDRAFDLGPEWRSFTDEDRTRRSRVGAPLTNRVHDRGLTTYIYASRSDIRARKLVALHSSLRAHTDEKLREVLQEANKVISRLNLPQRVAETMGGLIRRMVRDGILRRSSQIEYILAAAVIAARLENHPLTMRDAERIFGVDANSIWRAYRNIVTRLKVRVYKPPRPHIYIPKIVSNLKLPAEVETLAIKLADILAATKLSQGKPPEAIAAASVYLASILLDSKRNQLEVASAINVTDATIRNRYRDIVDNFYIEVRL
jgi:transcription initiation factor TFIIB